MHSKMYCALMLLLFAVSTHESVTYAQRDRQGTRTTGLVSLLDEDKAAFGLIANMGTVGNSPLDAIGHSRNRDIDFILYDMEHNPFDVTALRTYMQFLIDPGAIAKAGDLKGLKTVIARNR